MGCIPWYFDLGVEVGYLTSQCSYLEKFDNSFLAYYNLKNTFYASYYMPLAYNLKGDLAYNLKGDQSNVDREYFIAYLLHS